MTDAFSRRAALSLGAAFAVAAPLAQARSATPSKLNSGAYLMQREFIVGLQSDERDPTVSKLFASLARTRPWLRRTRKCVGQLYHVTRQDGKERLVPGGSAAILDDKGAVLLAGSEITAFQQSYGADAAVGNVIGFNLGAQDLLIPLTIELLDKPHDVVIGQLAEGAWQIANKEYGIVPVALGSPDIASHMGKQVVLVGYPAMAYFTGLENVYSTLHATTGVVQKFVDAERAALLNGDIVTYTCREETSAPVVLGFAGGAAFVNGRLIGTTSAGNSPSEANFNPLSSIVPLSYSLGLFQAIHADRAAALRIPEPVRSGPESCKVNLAAFLIK